VDRVLLAGDLRARGPVVVRIEHPDHGHHDDRCDRRERGRASDREQTAGRHGATPAAVAVDLRARVAAIDRSNMLRLLGHLVRR
jgi:hypothetical protein